MVLADFDGNALGKAVAGSEAAGQAVLGVRCDVSNEAEVNAMVQRMVDTFGRLDAAFNNAGIQIPSNDVVDMPDADSERVMAVNLRGVWSRMQAELRQVQKQGGGAIVNCSSIGGLIGNPGLAAYHATKYGVIGMIQSAALENAPRGIRLNAVCPETIDTPMVARMVKERAEAMDVIMAKTPIKRTRPARGDRRRGAVSMQRHSGLHPRRRPAGRWRPHRSLSGGVGKPSTPPQRLAADDGPRRPERPAALHAKPGSERNPILKT